jgi:hypothetical protein
MLLVFLFGYGSFWYELGYHQGQKDTKANYPYVKKGVIIASSTR